MAATIIDGKKMANELHQAITKEVARLRSDHGLHPALAVVLVGEDPASQVYVRSKARRTVEAEMQSFEHRLPDETSESELLELIAVLNQDDSVHGILVQLPLPSQINEDAVIESIDPAKDVDGFHPVNTGYLSTGNPAALIPCTPSGCMQMLDTYFDRDLSGRHAIVIGRSNIVGKPMVQLLLQSNCTVTIAHSRTKNLPDLCRQADILVAAVGRAEMVLADWVAPGAVVIDVGINRVPAAEAGKTRLVGDVDFEATSQIAGAITPVPGGVGPMTIACLLRNTVVAACRQTAVGCEL